MIGSDHYSSVGQKQCGFFDAIMIPVAVDYSGANPKALSDHSIQIGDRSDPASSLSRDCIVVGRAGRIDGCAHLDIQCRHPGKHAVRQNRAVGQNFDIHASIFCMPRKALNSRMEQWFPADELNVATSQASSIVDNSRPVFGAHRPKQLASRMRLGIAMVARKIAFLRQLEPKAFQSDCVG
jgi:hypothetical protein